MEASRALAPVVDRTGTDIEQIRELGRAEVARQKELTTLSRMLEGVQWGNVKGGQLSAQTRYAIARICDHYGADPLLHLHILGGNVYLNATYYEEQLNADPNVRAWRQENISALYSAELRKQAKAVFAEAKEFDAPELRSEALRLLALARTADERRAFFQVPDGAVAAYETIVDFADGRDSVHEANYAPNGQNDPVGKARPAETARTRSLRRAGKKSSSRIKMLDETATREGIEVEWEMVREDDRRAAGALPAADGPQAVATGAGEPAAAAPEGAQALPTTGQQEPAFDAAAARRGFFATLRDAGVADTERKQWTAKHNLPASTADWTQADFARAHEVLVAPVRAEVEGACEILAEDLTDLSRRILGKDSPAFLKDWKALQAELEKLAEGGEDL